MQLLPPFDYSKAAVIAKTMSELKAVLEMTTAHPDTDKLKDDDATNAQQLQQ